MGKIAPPGMKKGFDLIGQMAARSFWDKLYIDAINDNFYG